MSLCIMIVDDDVDDIDIFIDAVHEIEPGILCLSARNGLDAIKTIYNADEKPDYIFVDLNMPKLNGKQFIAELRKNDLFDGVKVIIYSTSKLEKDQDDAQSLGADGFITKPTSMEELCDSISKAIALDFHS
jgi:CheY-like chemotaxis protein